MSCNRLSTNFKRLGVGISLGTALCWLWWRNDNINEWYLHYKLQKKYPGINLPHKASAIKMRETVEEVKQINAMREHNHFRDLTPKFQREFLLAVNLDTQTAYMDSSWGIYIDEIEKLGYIVGYMDIYSYRSDIKVSLPKPQNQVPTGNNRI